MNMENQSLAQAASSPRIVLGVGVILLGTLLLLDHVPFLRDSRVLEFLISLWPLILVAMGAAKIRQSPTGRSGGGTALVLVGLFLLLISLSSGHFGAFVFPLLMVAGGIFLVTSTFKRQQAPIQDSASSEHYPQGTAILSAFKHRVLSPTFKGAELTAIFGGFDLDLRQTTIEGDSARIDIFVIFGGGEIRIPEGWDVVVQATAIASGVDNKAASLPVEGVERPKLIITGTLLFGGTEIKR